MKKLAFLFLLCLAFAKISFAQKDSLAFNEHSKYIYYRVIALNKDNADALYSRALNFTKTAYTSTTLKLVAQDNKATTVDGAGYFVVSKASSLAKHEDGKIAYKLHIEIKDQKYRYWLTDFVFTPYIKDRYDNFVPQPGIEIPMESITKQVEDKDATHYLDECGRFSRQLGVKLKQYMEAVTLVKKDDGTKMIDTKKW